MKNFPKLLSIPLLGLGLSMASQSVSAYNIIQCNNLNAMAGYGVRSFNYGANLFTSEEAAFTTVMARAGRFNTANPTGNAVSDPSVALNNGQNEIWWDSSHPTAVCNIYWVNTGLPGIPCVVTETDIRIGSPTWITTEDSTHSPYVSPLSSARSVHGTGIHEVGHCIGLAHENNTYNIMGQDWDHVTRNGTITFYGMGEDASNGLIALHGERSGGSDTYRDVGATVFRYQGTSGEYSAHKWGRLTTTGGSELAKSGSYVGQDVYLVDAGDTIQMELTLENNGEMNTETVNVGFYLSSNSTISTADTLLNAGNGYTLGRNTAFETTRNMTIPVTTAPGNWFVGAYADHDFLISESTALNNIAYYPITIPPPDLITQSPGVNDITLYPGQLFSANATVRNQGGAQSATTTLRYFRSTNSIISTADTEIGTDVVGVLNPDATSFEVASVLAPTTTGTYWVGGCVNSVAGESPTNNQCSSGVQINVASVPPTVSTDPATDITKTGATLHATTNPLGTSTAVAFEYGLDTNYGSVIILGSIGAGTSNVASSFPVTGLICNTTYHFRAVGSNSAGTTFGLDRTFTTEMCGGC